MFGPNIGHRKNGRFNENKFEKLHKNTYEKHGRSKVQEFLGVPDRGTTTFIS